MHGMDHCTYCRGELPLYEKQDKRYPYDLTIRLEDESLLAGGLLGCRIGRRDVLSRVKIAARVFYCPVCGARLGDKPLLGVEKECGCCKGDSLIELRAPGLLTVRVDADQLVVSASPGYCFAGRTAIVSSLDRTPVSYCPICGRNVSTIPSIKLGRGPFPGR